MDESAGGAAEGRRAPRVSVLSIGVGSFDEGGTEEELGFVAGRVEEVAKAFDRLNADVATALDLDEDEIETLLRRRLVKEPGPADVIVVHLVGHGRVDRGSRLSFVARDDREVDVDRWIEKAQQEVGRGGNRRRVVFLVDTCSAGTATGRQPFTELDVERGVWALGACVADTPTERGRFSGWVAAALHRLADRDFALDEESVSFGRFVREVIRVNRKDSAGLRLSLGFHVEQGDADWPFLPNPRLVGLTDEQRQLRQRSLGYVPGEGTGDASGSGDQQVDDSAYFADRASGRGLVPTDTGAGFFSGRAAELEQYTRWLAGDGPLLTVTGAAGAGKSGLLGVIVCAADPALRQRFRELWESAGRELPEVPGVVAVHARQRSAQQVVEAIASVAGLEREVAEGSADGATSVPWNARRLSRALAEEGGDRLLVIDAVDESGEPQEVLRLVADLLAPVRGTGARPCRILLGGRREVVTALHALEEVTHVLSEGIDLDTASPLTVEDDVQRYIRSMLRAREAYATGAPAEFVDVLAKRGARYIVRGARPSEPWGPFLLAGLYVHFLLTLKHPPQDEAGAGAYAKAASADLPSLLESILTTRRQDFPALRAVLAVLARSRGDGMPRRVLRRCLRASDCEDIDDEELRNTLWEASPYLRYGTDPQSGETLYRLFHQGLVDYLRSHPVSEDPLDEAAGAALETRLLAELIQPFTGGGDDGEDPWEAADDEPYVLRHALGHAAQAGSAAQAEALLTDPYFLVRFDLREDHRAMDLVRSEPAKNSMRLLSASWRTHARLRSASDRAAVFAFDAQRLGLGELRRVFADIARQLAVRPESAAYALGWAEGGTAVSGNRFVDHSQSRVDHVSFSPDGGLLAVTTWSGIELLETETWKPIAPRIGRGGSATVKTIAFSPDGRLLAIAKSSFRRSVQLWDVHHQVFAGPPWECRTGTATALSFSPDGRRLAVGSREQGVSVWDIVDGRPVERARREPGEDVEDVEEVHDVAFSPDGRLLVACGTAGVTLWESEDDRWTSISRTNAHAAAFSPDGRLLATTSRRAVSLRSAATREHVADIDLRDGDGSEIAFTPDGSLLVVGGWGSLDIVDVAAARVLDRPQSGDSVTAMAVHPVTGVLVSGDSAGRLALWKDFSQELQSPEVSQFEEEAVAGSPTAPFIAVHEPASRLLLLRDPATGRTLARMALGRGAYELFVSPDGRTLAALDHLHAYVFRLGSADVLPQPDVLPIGGRGRSASLTFSHDSTLMALAFLEQDTPVLMVWETATLHPCLRVPLPDIPRAYGFAGPHHLYAVVNGALATFALPTDPPKDTPA
ncbi:NACHT and WD repeat domain-containing protein [Streptomyces sp. NPDC005820]|uniref:NACHT and WD repeat domain-containing protein n=1 Tax=Streptomyces sp. NPDC005820 TaxID=3157069 RepID=UPI0033DA1077